MHIYFTIAVGVFFVVSVWAMYEFIYKAGKNNKPSKPDDPSDNPSDGPSGQA